MAVQGDALRGRVRFIFIESICNDVDILMLELPQQNAVQP